MSTIALGGSTPVTIQLTALLPQIPLSRGDVVLLTGTLVQGYGNSTSDIDIYILTDDLPVSTQLRTGWDRIEEEGKLRYFQGSVGREGPLFDIDYLTWHEVNDISASVRHAADIASKVLIMPPDTLSREQIDFVFNASTAIAVQGAQKWASIKAGLPLGNVRLVLCRDLLSQYGAFEDVVGTWQAGEMDNCLHMLRLFFASQVIALSQTMDINCYKPKWLMHIVTEITKQDVELGDQLRNWIIGSYGCSSATRQQIMDGLILLERVHGTLRRRLCKSHRQQLNTLLQGSTGTDCGFVDNMSMPQMRRRCFIENVLFGLGPTLTEQLEHRHLSDLPAYINERKR